ncbi:hypothetical protein FRC10_009431 [Ceratobasidium sp. 414]|nr:hypothetical protein FRC10_009431 [Ceratobasidium sp. 414]
MLGPALALLLATTVRAASQPPTACADDSMTLWMRNSAGKSPCELVQDVLRVCDPSVEIGFLPRNYSCDNGPGSALAPCCCGSPTFALMSACWSCQYNITFDLVTTTFTGFEKDCPSIPDPITSYDASVRSSINALDLPAWSMAEPLAGKWDMASAWKNATPFPTAAPPVPTGYPITVNSTGISKGALAGAIIGAILGSKLLFMLAGYLFWRWWRAQPDPQHDDEDEKGYAQRVLGEPRHRLSRRNRRGKSCLRVDLDEDTTSPRSSRWLGVPLYLQPTSFHTGSTRSDSPPGRFPPDLQFDGAGTGQPGDVTPFEGREPTIQSEKARSRRQSVSMRVINDPAGSSAVPRPQPALLASARRLSTGTTASPQSPTLPLGSPLNQSGSLVAQNRSNSRAHSLGSASGLGLAQRYQEDDAGVSLVIEDGHGSPTNSSEGVRCVPPAYVDYRTGYSRADKAPRFERWASGGSVEGTSESATCIGSESSNPTRAGSVKAGADVPGPSFESDRFWLRSGPGSSVEGVVEERDDVRTVGERDEGEVRTVTGAVENGSAPRTRPGTPLSTRNGTDDAARGTNESDVRDRLTGDESDARDRTASGDSQGTIKLSTVEPPRLSTADIAALTAVNTAANRSSGPDGAGQALPGAAEEPGPTRQASAGVVHSGAAESSWTWSRALGVFGITPGTGVEVPTKDT